MMAWAPPFRITVSDAVDTSSALGDWLRISQPAWEEPGIEDFNDWLDANNKVRSMYTIFSLLDEYRSFCSKEGDLEVEIEVHRSRADLPYTIFAHHGTIGAKSHHTKSHTKIVPIVMADSFDLDVVAIKGGATWDGKEGEQIVMNAKGEVITPPPITFTGSSFKWAEPVIGSLRISYKESHDAYILTIPSRKAGEYDPEETETAYETTVVATFAGGVEVHDVDIPDSSGTCRGGASVSINDGEEGEEGEGTKCIKLKQTIDKCDKTKVLSEERIEIPCPGEGEGAGGR